MQEYKVTVDEELSIRFYKPGTKELHRTDGPAIVHADGDKYWYHDDKLHRTGGPAVELADGAGSYWKDGKLHRTDGPAVNYSNGIVEYWIEGKELTEEQFKKKTAPVKEMTVAEIEAILGHSVKVVK